MTLPADYFAGLYLAHPDPWGFRNRWYERRKREVTLAALTRPAYRSGFEAGCSIGVLSDGLASRCDRLLAVDIDERAVAAAAAALGGHRHVTVQRRVLPAEWPHQKFDLVVLSEIGYYLSPADLGLLLDRALATLEPGGTLLACHWRHAVEDYPMRGDEVHAQLRARPALVSAVRHEEEDFLLDVMTVGRIASPARAEGLLK